MLDKLISWLGLAKIVDTDYAINRCTYIYDQTWINLNIIYNRLTDLENANKLLKVEIDFLNEERNKLCHHSTHGKTKKQAKK